MDKFYGIMLLLLFLIFSIVIKYCEKREQACEYLSAILYLKRQIIQSNFLQIIRYSDTLKPITSKTSFQKRTPRSPLPKVRPEN